MKQKWPLRLFVRLAESCDRSRFEIVGSRRTVLPSARCT
jgi:hypothetical protein